MPRRQPWSLTRLFRLRLFHLRHRVGQDAGYTNLISEFGGDNAYSFQFDGEFGYLDYALASEGLVANITGTTDWHINSDEPVVLDYNVEFKSENQQNTFYSAEPFRASDHDPVLVGIEFTPESEVVESDNSFVIGPNAIKRGEQITIEYSTSLVGNVDYRFQLFNSLTGQREFSYNDYLAPTFGETRTEARNIWVQPGIYIVQFVNTFTGEVFETTRLVVE